MTCMMWKRYHIKGGSPRPPAMLIVKVDEEVDMGTDAPTQPRGEKTAHERKLARARRRRQFWGPDAKAAFWFVLPALIGFSVFVLYPLIAGAYLSLTKFNGISDPVFVGLKNFKRLFTADPSFMATLKATGALVLLYVPASILLGLALALFCNVQLRGVRWVRTILYLPAVLPIVATVTLWKFIFDPQVGFANQVLGWLGIPPIPWLSSPTTAMPSVVIVMLWGVGSTMIILLAALQAVPQEIYEAARVDGASAFKQFIHVTIPGIAPILLLQFVMQLNGAMQTFVQPQILTGGGPEWKTTTLMLSIYNRAFPPLGRVPELGYATAQVWVLFILIILTLVVSSRFVKMWSYDAPAN